MAGGEGSTGSRSFGRLQWWLVVAEPIRGGGSLSEAWGGAAEVRNEVGEPLAGGIDDWRPEMAGIEDGECSARLGATRKKWRGKQTGHSGEDRALGKDKDVLAVVNEDHRDGRCVGGYRTVAVAGMGVGTASR